MIDLFFPIDVSNFKLDMETRALHAYQPEMQFAKILEKSLSLKFQVCCMIDYQPTKQPTYLVSCYTDRTCKSREKNFIVYRANAKSQNGPGKKSSW